MFTWRCLCFRCLWLWWRHHKQSLARWNVCFLSCVGVARCGATVHHGCNTFCRQTCCFCWCGSSIVPFEYLYGISDSDDMFLLSRKCLSAKLFTNKIIALEIFQFEHLFWANAQLDFIMICVDCNMYCVLETYLGWPLLVQIFTKKFFIGIWVFSGSVILLSLIFDIKMIYEYEWLINPYK